MKIIYMYIRYVTPNAKRDLMGMAKTINPGQRGQSAQDDHGRNFHYRQIFCVFK